MSDAQVAAERLVRHRLMKPGSPDAADAVAWFGAVQAQDYGAAKWALALRMRGAVTGADVDRAFNEGRILRTHLLRPTWHFVAAADIGWLLELTAPRVHQALAFGRRYFGLSDAMHRRAARTIARALERDDCLTRNELADRLDRAGVPASGVPLAFVIMYAELEGIICSGPRRGKQFTYMLLDERVPPAPALTRDEALRELVSRYFTSHGPAQPQDFAWWSGLTLGDARKGLALAGAQLSRETVDGKEFYFAASSAPPIPPAVYLLPNYDEYTVAYKDRSHFYDAADFQSPNARDNVPFANMLVVGGRVLGIWKRTLGSKSVQVTATWLRPPTPAQQRALAAAVKRYGEFLGLPAGLSA